MDNIIQYTNEFYYGDQQFAFYKKICIKVLKNGRHEVIPATENKEAGPGEGYQVSSFTWMGKFVIIQIIRSVKKSLNISLMSEADYKLITEASAVKK